MISLGDVTIEEFKEYVLNGGGNFELSQLLLQELPYEKFKDEYLKLLRKGFINDEDDSDQYSNNKLFEQIIDFDLDEHEYIRLLDDVYKSVVELSNLKKMKSGETSDYRKRNRFPIEKIMNGNFDKLDKTTLSEQDKVYYNVHGLHDETYDLYYDDEYKNIIPVYYDISTVNEHWFAFSVYLEKYFRIKGIDGNFKTPLMLFDRDLMGVDVDKVTNSEILVKIYREAKKNIYYHFREIARVGTTGDPEGTKRYTLNIASWSFMWLYAQNKNTFRQQSRQTGKTYDMGHTAAYEFSYGSNDMSMGIFHYKYQEATKNRKAWVDFANQYPKFLQYHNVVTRISKGKSYKMEAPEPMSPGQSKILENKELRNKFIAIAIGTSKMSAEQAGRGSTLRLVLGDELNFIKYIQLVFTAIMFAHGTARALAESEGKRTGMHFASTAGTLDTEQGRMMHDFIFKGMARFDPVLFTLSYNDLTKYLNKRSKTRFFLIDYSYAELGLDEEWMDNNITRSNTPEETRTEILNQWLSSAAGGLFTTDALSRLDHMSNKFPYKTFLYNKLNIFRFKSQYETFDNMIAQTSAMGIGGDFAYGDLSDSTSLTGINLITGERLFDFDSNTITAPDTSVLIISLIRYIKKINPTIKLVMIPEIDAVGRTIIPVLTREPDIEPHIFKQMEFTNKKIEDPYVKSVSYSLSEDTVITYGTSMRKIRDRLFNTLLFELVDKYPFTLSDQATSNEVKTLVKNTRGKILAKSGFHDDKVCSTLHAYSLIFIPEYADAIRQFLNLYIDRNNLEADPLNSTVFNLKEEEEKVEGRVSWKILKHKDEFGDIYETIEVQRIDRGVMYKLTKEEYNVISETNEELRHVLDNLVHKKIRLNSFGNNQDYGRLKSTNDFLLNSSKKMQQNTIGMSQRRQQELLKKGLISRRNLSLI